VLLAGILSLDADERVTAVFPISDFDQAGFLMMVTRLGKAKRTVLKEFASVRPSGLIALRLREDDELGWVLLTTGGQDVIVVTEQGRALRFNEEDVRAVGRTAIGVSAMNLAPGDAITSACVVAPEADILVVSTQGYGKRTKLTEYITKGRNGKGVRCIGGDPATRGVVADARVVQEDDEVLLMSADGMMLRTQVQDVPQMGRSARGAKMMELKEGDVLMSLAVLDAEEMESEQDAQDTGEA
jgi:DNA gyrase subunit A